MDVRGGGAPSNLDCYTGGAEGSTRRGVFWVPSRGSWRAEHGGVSLGFFADELDAALAYDVKARALGEPVNFKKYRHDKTVAEERAEQRALVKREAANINGASAPASRHEHSASTQRRVLNKVSVLSTAARLLALARKKKRETSAEVGTQTPGPSFADLEARVELALQSVAALKVETETLREAARALDDEAPPS